MGPDGKWMGIWRYPRAPKGGSCSKVHRLCPPRWRNPRPSFSRAPTGQHRVPPVRTLYGQPPHVPQLSIVRTDPFSMKPGFQPSIPAGDQFLWRCHRLGWGRAVGPAECNFRNLRSSAASADKPRVMGPPLCRYEVRHFDPTHHPLPSMEFRVFRVFRGRNRGGGKGLEVLQLSKVRTDPF